MTIQLCRYTKAATQDTDIIWASIKDPNLCNVFMYAQICMDPSLSQPRCYDTMKLLSGFDMPQATTVHSCSNVILNRGNSSTMREPYCLPIFLLTVQKLCKFRKSYPYTNVKLMTYLTSSNIFTVSPSYLKAFQMPFYSMFVFR